MSPFTLQAKEHPNLILTKPVVERMRDNLGQVPLFDTTLSSVKQEVDAEIAMGIVLLFPLLKPLLAELIEPEDPAVAAIYNALKEAPDVQNLSMDMLILPEDYKERVSILMLYCEHLDFGSWSGALAEMEMRKNCTTANNVFLKKKQREIAVKLQNARQEGNSTEENKLASQYAQVLKLATMANKS